MNNTKNNDFLQSVEAFQSSSSTKETVLKKKSSGALNPTRLLIIFLCFAIFVYSSYSLFEIYKSNLASGSLYNDIYSDFADILNNDIIVNQNIKPQKSLLLPSTPNTPSKGGDFKPIDQNTTSIKFQQSLSKLESLRSQNKHTVGYISISGTGINYPILQCEDNDYYLNHGFDNTNMKGGSIFYDFRCSPTPSENKNLIVYGHNMSNGTMFQQLENYTLNEDLFKNGTITVYAFDAIYTYEIFSVYYTDAYSDYLKISFRGNFDFEEWAKQRAELSMFKKDVKIEGTGSVISLSTCINATSDGRIAVHGILTNVEQ
ncbi:MAG: class B sortase [Clostridia bacterium]|nr:class B sortase [Clostridia bacterium]